MSFDEAYIKAFGFFFFLKIAVEVSSSCPSVSILSGVNPILVPSRTAFFSAPEGSLSAVSMRDSQARWQR